MSKGAAAGAAVLALWLNGEANARATNQTELEIAIANATASREEESILRRGAAAFLAMQQSGQMDPALLAQVHEAEALLRQRTQQMRELERQQMVAEQQSQVEQWKSSRRKALRTSDSEYLSGCLVYVLASGLAVIALFTVGIFDFVLGFLAMVFVWFVTFALLAARSNNASNRVDETLAREEQPIYQDMQAQRDAFDADTEAMLSGDTPVAFQRAELPSPQSSDRLQQPLPPPPPPPAPSPRR